MVLITPKEWVFSGLSVLGLSFHPTQGPDNQYGQINKKLHDTLYKQTSSSTNLAIIAKDKYSFPTIAEMNEELTAMSNLSYVQQEEQNEASEETENQSDESKL